MTQNNIIFLNNISLSDYKNIEDEFNERLLENMIKTDYNKYYENKYDQICPIFETIELWTKVNNIRCWTCDFTFDSIPIFIPTSIRAIENKWNISVLGNFCSFNCSCRYIIDYLNNELLNNLIKLYEIYYNTKIKKIDPSPRRHIMEKYGGYMTEENYLLNIKKLSLKIENKDNIIKRQYTAPFQPSNFNNYLSSEDEEPIDNI